jgi:acyl carrier protein
VLPDREELAARLLAIVSERTGYPVEMLSLDQDLEADLGIDSIKRVEILGNFQKSFASTAEKSTEELMEKLAGVKTLGSIIEWVTDRVVAPPAPVGPKAALLEAAPGDGVPVDGRAPALERGVEETSEEASDIQRYVLTTVETPSRGGRA